MSTELTTQEAAAQSLAALNPSTEIEIPSVTYLPRIQIMGSSSNIVKEGKFPIGDVALISGQNHESLGKSVNVLICGIRYKAMCFEPEVVSVYDTKDPMFAEFRDRADANSQSGCMYGVEFLLFLTDTGRFATFFCGNVSLRREAALVKSIYDSQMQKQDWIHAVLSSEFVKNKKGQSWHTGKIAQSQTVPVMYPQVDKLQSEVSKFDNPPKQEVAQDVSQGRD
jgi:hypothetical protein